MRGSTSPAFFLFLFSFSLWFVPATAQQKCYAPNGTETNQAHGLTGSDSYFSCNITRGGGIHSMCCRLGDGLGYDICLDSGLCQNSVPGSVSYWRESCTDPSWLDAGCLQLYNEGEDSSGFDLSTNDVELLRCPDGSFCSGAKNTTCCQKSQGFFVNDNGDISPATAAQSSSSPPSTATTTPTMSSTATTGSANSTPTAVQSNTTPTNQSNKTGVIVGAVIGGVAGVALILGLLWLCIYVTAPRCGTGRQIKMARRRRQMQAQQAQQDQASAMVQSYYGPDANKVRYGREGEVKGGMAQVGEEQRYELYAERRPVELQDRLVELEGGSR